MDREKYARALRRRLERKREELDQQVGSGDLHGDLVVSGRAGGIDDVIRLLDWFDSASAEHELADNRILTGELEPKQ